MATYIVGRRMGRADGGGGGVVAAAARPPRGRLVALLAEIRRTGSLRTAARSLGIAPGNAHRLIRSEERRLGVRLLVGSPGGAGGGGSHLTAAGQRLAHAHRGLAVPAVTWWPCRVADPAARRSPIRVIVPEAGVVAAVAPTGAAGSWTARLRRGSELELGIAPEALTIVRRTSKPGGSARNLWPARVVQVRRPAPFGVRFVELQVGERRLTAAVTSSSVEELHLRRGSGVQLQAKATALRLRSRPGV